MKNAILHLTKSNSVFSTIIKKYGLPNIPIRPQGFETMVLLILEQQVSIESAKATFLKLKAKANHVQPEILISLADDTYRSLGVSRQKTKYIKGLSTAIIEKKINFESLSTKSSSEVREELIKIKGIGNWTIDIYLMFCLQDQDLIPLGDIAVVHTIKELFDRHSKEEMVSLTENWKPFRSYATYLLWHYYLNKRNRKLVF